MWTDAKKFMRGLGLGLLKEGDTEEEARETEGSLVNSNGRTLGCQGNEELRNLWGSFFQERLVGPNGIGIRMFREGRRTHSAARSSSNRKEARNRMPFFTAISSCCEWALSGDGKPERSQTGTEQGRAPFFRVSKDCWAL